MCYLLFSFFGVDEFNVDDGDGTSKLPLTAFSKSFFSANLSVSHEYQLRFSKNLESESWGFETNGSEMKTYLIVVETSLEDAIV